MALALLALPCAGLAQEAPALPPTPPASPGTSWSLASVDFLAGCWEGPREGDGDGVLEERFSPPRGGEMVGTSRYLDGGRLTAVEFSRVVEDGAGVVLVPYPAGQQSAVGFRLTQAGPGRAEFTNASHDFPTRIEYSLVPASGSAQAAEAPGALRVRVDGPDGEGFAHLMQPVACAGPGAPSDVLDFGVFRGDGTPVDFGAALNEMQNVDVVFLGENHDDDVTHVLQARVLEALHRQTGDTRRVVLSMEMLESDVQGVVDEYRLGLITEDHFLQSSRPWPRYTDHYRPMVEYARTHGLPIVAANPPRRYVNLVGREGPDALERLSPEARALLPPLPLPPPSNRYRAQWDSLMGGAGRHGTPGQSAPSPHGTASPDTQEAPPISNGLWAQTLWDAGMAHAVAGALDDGDQALVVHLAGAFHVDRGTGIPEHLARLRPDVRMITVVFRPADAELSFQPDLHEGLGDMVVLTRTRAATGEGR